MKKKTPIEKNKEYILEMTGQGHEGQGIGRIENFTVFVEGALAGEKVEVKIVKVASSYAYGKLLKVIEKSDDRVEPSCEVYKKCGGCHLQHLSYEAQLRFKTRLVYDNIYRIGGLTDVKIKETIGMKNSLNYRNKAQYPIGLENGQIIFGFYAERTHDIISGTGCCIQDEVSYKIASSVRDYMNKNEITPYDESTGKGTIRHVVVRSGFVTGEIMVIIVANDTKFVAGKELAEFLIKKYPKIKSVIHNINTKRNNLIMGEKNNILAYKDYITDKIGQFTFKISPTSFYQVNPVQTGVMYKKVLEYAGLTGKETVYDLYCGIGTISLFLSKKAKKVYGIESVESAVKDAIENAKINSVKNAEFICGEVEKIMPELVAKGKKASVVVLDPPRKGCERVLIDTVIAMAPKRVVYVSCNPATLARDLRIFADNGYDIVEVQPVDMFPHTYHVEAVTLLVKELSD